MNVQKKLPYTDTFKNAKKTYSMWNPVLRSRGVKKVLFLSNEEAMASKSIKKRHNSYILYRKHAVGMYSYVRSHQSTLHDTIAHT